MKKQSVTRQASQRMTRSFGISFGAAALALACGANDSNNQDEPSKVVDIQRPDPCANPLNAECPSNQPPPNLDTSTNTGNSAGPAAPKPPPSQADLDKAAAENVLKSDCGYCHGPALTQQQAKAGMNYIDDIDQLVANGKIVPMNSAGSKVIQRMVTARCRRRARATQR